MRSVRVKICGITRKEDLLTAVSAGADAVGFIVDVPSSPRNLRWGDAKNLIKLVPPFVKSVVVTVPRNIEGLIRLCEELVPDAVQIHGDALPNSEARERMPCSRLIKAIYAESSSVVKVAVEASKFFDAILLDSPAQGSYGGTGKTHSWELSREVREAIHPEPLILAGGLNPENVSEAIRIVQPYAVDVSTGVESKPGIKDPAKISEFIKNARDVEL